jgi:hypothetical protein
VVVVVGVLLLLLLLRRDLFGGGAVAAAAAAASIAPYMAGRVLVLVSVRRRVPRLHKCSSDDAVHSAVACRLVYVLSRFVLLPLSPQPVCSVCS